jgi:hypothetical protein
MTKLTLEEGTFKISIEQETTTIDEVFTMLAGMLIAQGYHPMTIGEAMREASNIIDYKEPEADEQTDWRKEEWYFMPLETGDKLQDGDVSFNPQTGALFQVVSAGNNTLPEYRYYRPFPAHEVE